MFLLVSACFYCNFHVPSVCVKLFLSFHLLLQIFVSSSKIFIHFILVVHQSIENRILIHFFFCCFSTNNWNLLVFVVTAEEHRFFVVILAYCWYSTAALAAGHKFPLIAQCFGCNITTSTCIACITLLCTSLCGWIIRIIGLDSDTSTTFVTFIFGTGRKIDNRTEWTYWKLIVTNLNASCDSCNFV